MTNVQRNAIAEYLNAADEYVEALRMLDDPWRRAEVTDLGGRSRRWLGARDLLQSVLDEERAAHPVPSGVPLAPVVYVTVSGAARVE